MRKQGLRWATLGLFVSVGLFTASISSAEPQVLGPARDRIQQLLSSGFHELPALNLEEGLSVRAWIKEGSKGPLVGLISGTHGAEALPGFEVQEDFLKEFAKTWTEKGRSVLIIHGLNPWGIENGRRVTKNNIDLNRHFHGGQISNRGFETMASFLRRSSPARDSWWSWLQRAQGLLQPLILFQLTRAEITQAVAGGQTSDPEGLFFGGQSEEPQKEWLTQVILPLIRRAPQAVLLDLHTGLGQREVLHLIPGSASWWSAWLSSQNLPTSLQWTPPTAKGFYTSQGDLLSFLESQGGGPGKVLALTLEWGTQGKGLLQQISSLNTMALENEGWHAGWSTAQDREQVQIRFREMFAPTDPKWRLHLLKSSRQFFQLLDRGLTSAPR